MKVKTDLFSILGLMLMGASCLMTCVSLALIWSKEAHFYEWDIYLMSGVAISACVVVDWMGGVFLATVCLISGSIMVYSLYYMEGEKHYLRFLGVLLMFVLSMWFLIISPNMVSLLLGWDGLGLTSYVLVIFYQSEASNSAGMLTILSNRLGDVAILIGVALTLGVGSWSFYVWEGEEVSSAALGVVVLAAMTKSAQLPFSAWLPAAMAAPTPVSALVHSSTLVTAGVFLMIRYADMLCNRGMQGALFWVALGTMIMAGLNANLEMDLKKTIALSTLSQLGFMLMSVAAGLKSLAFFHLVMHAMFKSTLFMCGGFVIHMSQNWQDMRGTPSVYKSSPNLMVGLGVTNLALLGFPFLSGYYSKDLVLESLFSEALLKWGVVLSILGAGLTVTYSVRVVFISVMNNKSYSPVSGLGDYDNRVIGSSAVLSVISVLGGAGLGWLSFYSDGMNMLSAVSKLYILMITMSAGVFFFFKGDKNSGGNVKGLSLMWYLHYVSSSVSGLKMFASAHMSGKVLEMGWYEYYGGSGCKSTLMKWNGFSQESQSQGSLQKILMMCLMMMLLLSYLN